MDHKGPEGEGSTHPSMECGSKAWASPGVRPEGQFQRGGGEGLQSMLRPLVGEGGRGHDGEGTN